MYPHIPNGSIGWRMGYGESYGDEFYRWFHTLSRDEKEEYNRKFPEPVCWSLSEYNLMRIILSGHINGTGIPAAIIPWKSFGKKERQEKNGKLFSSGDISPEKREKPEKNA